MSDLCLVSGHSDLNPQWCITILTIQFTTQNPLSTHAHPPTQQQTLISLPRCLLSHLDLCVAQASCFSSPPLLSVLQHRGGESSAARKQNKTMESVRHSKANGFTAASSPPSLFMCKSIHRVLMALAMHDTDSFKWPSKKKESFTHLQSWQKTIQEGCIESAFLSQDAANVCLPL